MASGSTSSQEEKNDIFLRAARGETVKRTPVWAMRQAGRYLPEYNATRAEAGSFFGLCQNPELVAEVTLQPLRRFALDAAIIFSDILVIPQALGLEVVMVEKHGPSLPQPIRDPEQDMQRVRYPADVSSSLSYVYEAIRLTKAKLDGLVPLIGFSGAPWTLMCYMIEGSGSKTFSEAKRWLYRYPEHAHRLLAILADVVADHLICQAEAGADALMVFDSWAGELSPEAFQEFGLPYLKSIAEKIREKFPAGDQRVPLIVFPKGSHYALESIVVDTLYDVIGIDWTLDPAVARQRVNDVLPPGRTVTLQGNLDPCILYADPKEIQAQTAKMVKKFGPQKLIANLGHGMHPSHNPEHLKVFVDTVHSVSQELVETD